MRGEVNVDPRHDYIRGITPACAGRRLTFSRPDALVEDHPRVCGEKRESVASAAVTQGSPPRVRGEVVDKRRVRHRDGITPACAGRRRGDNREKRMREDHPRVCGEKPATLKPSSVTWGSPPRVRGEVAAPQLGLLGIGITPACAGRSLASSVLPVGREDHPRVCGEKQISSWVP